MMKEGERVVIFFTSPLSHSLLFHSLSLVIIYINAREIKNRHSLTKTTRRGFYAREKKKVERKASSCPSKAVKIKKKKPFSLSTHLQLMSSAEAGECLALPLLTASAALLAWLPPTPSSPPSPSSRSSSSSASKSSSQPAFKASLLSAIT